LTNKTPSPPIYLAAIGATLDSSFISSTLEVILISEELFIIINFDVT
jgi:hypothetical protein